MKRKKYGGRAKGTPNHIHKDVRAMIENALHMEGGEKYLREQARDNPTAFMALVGKLLPKDVNLKADVNMHVRDELIERAMALMLGKPLLQKIESQELPALTAEKVEPISTEY